MKYKYLIIFIFIFYTTKIVFGTSINGIEIPKDLESKFKEYRYRAGGAYAASVDSTYEYSVEEFDTWLKNRVKYDSTHFCPICKVFFPILSSSLNKNNSIKTNKLCLDGYPEIIDSPLPPECPYCLCICPEGEFGYQNTIELTYSVFGHTAPNLPPCERYLEFVETLHGEISDYERFQVYFKYAICGICKDSELYLKKAYDALNIFISKNFKNELEKDGDKDSLYYWDFNVFFQRVELLRQLGDFKLALEYLSELEKFNKYSYRGIVLELERKLINEHNSKRIQQPFGNVLHKAIKAGKSISKLNFSHDDLLKLTRQTNINDNTPFQQAILAKNYDYIKFLLKSVPEIIKIEETDRRLKPLHYAAKVGDIQIIELLLKSGCDIEGKSDQIQTPVFLAIRFGHYDAVCYFIQQGANLEVEDQDHNKPLQVACYSCNKDGKKILEKLIEIKKKKYDYKESIQKCYRVAENCDYTENYNILKKTGIKDFSSISKIDTKFVYQLIKENGAENLLFHDFSVAMNGKDEEILEAFKKTDLYDIFMKRYEEEHGKLKTEN